MCTRAVPSQLKSVSAIPLVLSFEVVHRNLDREHARKCVRPHKAITPQSHHFPDVYTKTQMYPQRRESCDSMNLLQGYLKDRSHMILLALFKMCFRVRSSVFLLALFKVCVRESSSPGDCEKCPKTSSSLP